MRKFNKFAYASAMLLAGGMVLASCSSDDELTNANPTYDGESVKAQFAISVPGYAVNGSRMTAGEAQEEVFNGITGLQLFPLKLNTAGDTVGSTGTLHATLAYSPIPLANIAKTDGFNTNTTNPSWEPATQANVKTYNDIKLDMGINAFLVYGKAMHVSGVDASADSLTASYDVEVLTSTMTEEKINFSLVPCYKENSTASDANLKALNDIAEVLMGISAPSYGQLKANMQGLTAGSSLAIQALVEDLWNTSAKLDNNNSTTDPTYPGYALRAKIVAYFTVTPGTLGEETVEWTTNPNFPEVANLPDGAVAVAWNDGESKFAYNETTSVDGLAIASRNLYVLPAQLYYRSNTPIRVKDATVFETESHYKGKTWEQILAANYNTTGAGADAGKAVSASTRSVVLEKELQYAVADLATQVKVSSSPIKDKKGNIVSVPAGGYQMTGILIGGQKNVDFKFYPISSAPEYTLYDKTVQDKNGAALYAKPGAYSNLNHTLVLETAGAADEEVRIAVEFVNKGKDFYGHNGQLIPAGGKFYLVASLKVNALGTTKPFTSMNQVFKQDYTTTASLNITTLANAYNVIPDLRAPQLEFGMSVDLKWQTGMTFEVDFN